MKVFAFLSTITALPIMSTMYNPFDMLGHKGDSIAMIPNLPTVRAQKLQNGLLESVKITISVACSRNKDHLTKPIILEQTTIIVIFTSSNKPC